MKKKSIMILCCELALFFSLFFLLNQNIEAEELYTWSNLASASLEDESVVSKEEGKEGKIKEGKIKEGKTKEANLTVEKQVVGYTVVSASTGPSEGTAINNPLMIETEKEKYDNNVIEIVAFGDNLVHTSIINTGKQKDGTYDFDFIFENVKDAIQSADIAIINQETILSTADLGYTGYPNFGTPVEMGQAILDAGFDVVLHATNHAMDKGVKGVFNTLDFWKNLKDIAIVGLNASKNESSRVAFLEVEDMTLAILNYTYGLNGHSLPKGEEYLVNMLNDKEKIKKDIQYAKERADFLIVCPHWGTEYSYEPNQNQKSWVNFFLEQEVDLVLGTHPHVLQPVEQVESEKTNHKMLVYYSLGNFISSQDQVPRLLGGMARIKLVKYEGKVEIVDSELVPIVTHYNYKKKEHTTYFLSDYNQQLADYHSIKDKTKKGLTLVELEDLYKNILNESY